MPTTPPKYIRILIAEDEVAVAEMFEHYITHKFQKKYGLQVVGLAHTATQTLEQTKLLNPDILLLDWFMPGCDTGAWSILSEFPKLKFNGKVLVFSFYNGNDFIQKVFESGANGYFWKMNHAENLAIALRQVSDQGFYVSSEAVRAMAEFRQHQLTKSPNAIQLRVLELMSKGYDNKTIAQIINQPVDFVENRRTELFKLLGANNAPHAIAVAIDKGLLPGKLMFDEQEFSKRVGAENHFRAALEKHKRADDSKAA